MHPATGEKNADAPHFVLDSLHGAMYVDVP
jgi:hypothetical protein